MQATVLGLKESVTYLVANTTCNKLVLHQSSVSLHLHLAPSAQEVDFRQRFVFRIRSLYQLPPPQILLCRIVEQNYKISQDTTKLKSYSLYSFSLTQSLSERYYTVTLSTVHQTNVPWLCKHTFYSLGPSHNLIMTIRQLNKFFPISCKQLLGCL